MEIRQDKNTTRILSALSWYEKCQDDRILRQIKLDFAKAGLFNPRTFLDDEKYLQNCAKGKVGNLNPFYMLEQYQPATPINVRQIRRVLLDTDGRRRSSGKMFYKSFCIEETVSPINLTHHAISRYRERSGEHINEEMLWETVVAQPPAMEIMGNGKMEKRKDLLQPTENGAWLGFPAMSDTHRYLYRYSRKKGFSEGSDGVMRHTFNALTWVPLTDMLDFQYNAWKAYRDGDSELAISIMSANKNTYQTDELLDWIVAD
jgi:hypothetical protein